MSITYAPAVSGVESTLAPVLRCGLMFVLTTTTPQHEVKSFSKKNGKRKRKEKNIEQEATEMREKGRSLCQSRAMGVVLVEILESILQCSRAAEW